MEYSVLKILFILNKLLREKMKNLVSIEKISEILDINVKTIYDWTSTRKIPHYKLGRLVKFDVDEVMAWLQSCEVKVYNRGTGGKSQFRR
ncbi:MAG: helix-turn-helix domain-containing protein [bacterium]